jgi:hypothetical protein
VSVRLGEFVDNQVCRPRLIRPCTADAAAGYDKIGLSFVSVFICFPMQIESALSPR